MQEREDKRVAGVYAGKGMPERKDGRTAGLCLRKGKGNRMAQKNADGYFPIYTACRSSKAGNTFKGMEIQLIRLNK